MSKAFFAGAWGAIVVATMIGAVVWLWHVCAKANSLRLEKDESEKRDAAIDHLALKPHLDIWLHQNTILWNRLVTISALQVPIIGGWAATLNWMVLVPMSIAGIGALLSLAILKLILCDLDRREHHKGMIECYFSKHPKGVPGYVIIELIAALFFCIDLMLILLGLTKTFLHCDFK